MMPRRITTGGRDKKALTLESGETEAQARGLQLNVNHGARGAIRNCDVAVPHRISPFQTSKCSEKTQADWGSSAED